jgi:hypothetical protein
MFKVQPWLRKPSLFSQELSQSMEVMGLLSYPVEVPYIQCLRVSGEGFGHGISGLFV